MKKLSLYVIAILLSVTSLHAMAKRHGRDTTTCYTQAAIVGAIGVNLNQIATADLNLINAFCQKYLSIPESKEKQDVLHSKIYHAERLSVIDAMQREFALLQSLGKDQGVPNPNFLLAANDAKHEWMPSLYALTSLLGIIEAEFGHNAKIAIYLKDIEQFLPQVDMHAGHSMPDRNVLTDKDHSSHYGAMHPVGDAMINILAEVNAMYNAGEVKNATMVKIRESVKVANVELYSFVFKPSLSNYDAIMYALLGLFGLLSFSFRKRLKNLNFN